MALAAHDARLERGGDAAVAGEVLGDDRLLEPVGIELVDAVAGLDGGVGVPAHIDVDHDLYAAAHRLAHRLDVLHVLAPRPMCATCILMAFSPWAVNSLARAIMPSRPSPRKQPEP